MYAANIKHADQNQFPFDEIYMYILRWPSHWYSDMYLSKVDQIFCVNFHLYWTNIWLIYAKNYFTKIEGRETFSLCLRWLLGVATKLGCFIIIIYSKYCMLARNIIFLRPTSIIIKLQHLFINIVFLDFSFNNSVLF